MGERYFRVIINQAQLLELNPNRSLSLTVGELT